MKYEYRIESTDEFPAAHGRHLREAALEIIKNLPDWEAVSISFRLTFHHEASGVYDVLMRRQIQ